MSDRSIIVEDLWKGYKLGTKKSGDFRSTLSNMFSGNKDPKSTFWALKKLDFTINKGDAVGIIGRNGAGKSTLLKILSRITHPSKGKFVLNGRVSSLLEVGTGFHPELTGRENIYLNGTILGMSRAEVKQKFNEIVEFSGIAKFIDTPVKRYSSGMYVRLAFAVAAHLEPEILIVDEVLAVGDAEFQKKCMGKMKDVSTNDGRTVLFVSHNMGAIKSLCNVGMMLNKGTLAYHGNIDKTINEYLNSSTNEGRYIPDDVKEADIALKEVFVADNNLKECIEFNTNDEVVIGFDLHIKKNDELYNLFCTIKDKYGNPVFSAEKRIEREKMYLHIDPKFLTRGMYSIDTFIHIPKVMQIDRANDICGFAVVDTSSNFVIHGDYEYGNVFGSYTWK